MTAGPRWTIEAREDPVSLGADFNSAEALDLAPSQAVVVLQHLVPPAIAELGRSLRRTHDVGEEQCC